MAESSFIETQIIEVTTDNKGAYFLCANGVADPLLSTDLTGLIKLTGTLITAIDKALDAKLSTLKNSNDGN